MDHYYFHIGDYRRKTVHLTHDEHFMYRWLIDEYFLTETPIITDLQVLTRKMRLTSDQKPILEQLLKEFFILEDNGWYHPHVEQVMARVHAKSEQSKRAINTRWERTRSLQKEYADDTDVIRTNNEKDTDVIPTNNQEPITNNQKKQTKGAKRSNGRFQKPTEKQVQDYINKREISGFTGQTFCDFYIARNWQLSHGKQMSDWKAAVRTWENRRMDEKPDTPYGHGAQ